ncbi:MAG: signal recognition particle-docking protein FtsY [Myxococcales bacterium]|nr:signal recognition particle-docking protein FtsY [Myxococcales bacterium]
MGSTELVYLAIFGVVIALLVFWLRRAADASRKQASSDLRERLQAKPSARQRRDDAAPAPPLATTADADDEPAIPSATEPSSVAQETPPNDDARAVREGLAKTRGGFVSRLGKLFARKAFDQATLDELEEVLFTADIGPRAADKMFQEVKAALSKDDLADTSKVWAQLKSIANAILRVDSAPLDFSAQRPLVLLTIGVNGAGKTTTIGKLAAHLTSQRKRVLLAAGDTFRAAATEQLVEWAKRAGVDVVTGKSGSDPSSVIFDAVKKGVEEGFDVVICDTAGRLHSNTSLMEELKKIRRVCDKACPGAPHETWLVLDATNGQNAIAQAKTFKADMAITGIVLTKLDGTAKGGVILGICDELSVPVRYIGVGEKITDLRPFDAETFVDALFDQGAA